MFTHWPFDNHADYRGMANLTYESWKQLKWRFALCHFTQNPCGGMMSVIASRVENRRSGFSLPVAVGCFRMTRLNPVWRNSVSCSRSSNRTGRFPASGSRKRLTRSPTEGSRSGVVTGPTHTQSAETLPENVRMPAVARCVCHITTDAAECGHEYRSHYKPC